MGKKLDLYEKPYLRFKDSSRDSQIDAFSRESNLNPLCREMDNVPDLLRKSMERFLIGNVI